MLAGSSAFNYANATSCATSGAPLTREDATWNTVISDDCAGPYDGNDYNNGNGTGLTNLNGGLFDSAVFTSDPGSTWSKLVSDDTDNSGNTSGTLNGIQFTLDSGQKVTSGTWNLSWVDTNGSAPMNLPIQIDFAVALKGATSYALYFFNDKTFGTDGTGSGTFNISFENNGANNPALSHLSIYVRDPVQLPQGPRPPREVPEPSVLALLGIGLLSISKSFGRKQRGA